MQWIKCRDSLPELTPYYKDHKSSDWVLLYCSKNPDRIYRVEEGDIVTGFLEEDYDKNVKWRVRGEGGYDAYGIDILTHWAKVELPIDEQ